MNIFKIFLILVIELILFWTSMHFLYNMNISPLFSKNLVFDITLLMVSFTIYFISIYYSPLKRTHIIDTISNTNVKLKNNRINNVFDLTKGVLAGSTTYGALIAAKAMGFGFYQLATTLISPVLHSFFLTHVSMSIIHVFLNPLLIPTSIIIGLAVSGSFKSGKKFLYKAQESINQKNYQEAYNYVKKARNKIFFSPSKQDWDSFNSFVSTKIQGIQSLIDSREKIFKRCLTNPYYYFIVIGLLIISVFLIFGNYFIGYLNKFGSLSISLFLSSLIIWAGERFNATQIIELPKQLEKLYEELSYLNQLLK